MSNAGEQYIEAHNAHYVAKNLTQALDHYTAIMASHPDTPEAGYAHAQMHNIANSVVPKQELLDATVKLARTHILEAADSEAPTADAPLG